MLFSIIWGLWAQSMQNSSFSKGTETIYHGTITHFSEIDVSKGEPYKDFGRGFYAAEKLNQAEGLAISRKVGKMNAVASGIIRRPSGVTLCKFEANIIAYLYTYAFDIAKAKMFEKQGMLRIKVFESADLEWFDFVLHNRDTEPTIHEYDIVKGPTANDDTFFVINRYHTGKFGNVGSYSAKQKALKALKAQKLGIQYYFKNELAVSTLKKIEERIVMNVTQHDVTLLLENMALILMKQTGKDQESVIKELFLSKFYKELLEGKIEMAKMTPQTAVVCYETEAAQ